jgi:hypothetical protein
MVVTRSSAYRQDDYLLSKSTAFTPIFSLKTSVFVLYFLLSFPNKIAFLFTFIALYYIDTSLIFNDPNNP